MSKNQYISNLFLSPFFPSILNVQKAVAHLDPLGPVDEGVLPVLVGAVDQVEGVALAEQVLLVQVLGR